MISDERLKTITDLVSDSLNEEAIPSKVCLFTYSTVDNLPALQ